MKRVSSKKLQSDIWPNEREVIESPHRMQYVRKIIKPEGCVFCTAAKSKPSAESLVVFSNKNWMVVLNKYPYNNGHLLITPKKHIAEFEKLADSSLMEMQLLTKHSLKILKKVYQPQGFNTGMNLGDVAGAGIPNHLHYHIVPRWGGDTNFFPLIAQTKLVIETGEQSFEKLRPHFAKLEKAHVL